MLNKIKKNYLLTTAVILFFLLFPQTAFAAAKNWNSETSPLTSKANSGSAISQTPDDICAALFKGDQDNIYRVTICDLVRIVALSVSNLARDITCTVQQVGYGGNYDANATFASSGGNCTSSGNFDFPAPGGGSRESQVSLNLKSGGSLSSTATSATSPTSVAAGYNITRNIVSVLVVVALLFFAFANILHINLNTYSVKKALPAVIFALVGAWLSIFIIYLASRLVDAMFGLSIFAPGQALNPMQNIFGGALEVTRVTSATTTQELNEAMSLVFQVGANLIGGSGTTVNLASGIFGTILLIVPAIVVFIFEYVLALRPFAIGLLTIAAPFAFASTIFPQAQIVFRKWWTFLLIAIFYAPLVNFVFFILNIFPVGTNAIAALILWAFKIAVIVFLARLPFTIENDLKKLTIAISKTDIGNQLGFGRLAAAIERSKSPAAQVQTITDKIFSSGPAKKIVADTTLRRITGSLGKAQNIATERGARAALRESAPDLARVLTKANETNLSRPAALLARSVADLTPQAFKAVVDQSDLKLWHDTRLIEQLKNQNGQTLDDEGAAIRADSARKLNRLAEVVENGKIQNPEAIKALAQKGALGGLSTAIIKKALQDEVLSQADLIPTYKSEAAKAYQHIQTADTTGVKFISSKDAQNLIAQDHMDYLSGFKDIATIMEGVAQNRQTSAATPAMIKAIVAQIKNANAEGLERHGEYFLRRFAQEQKNAGAQISSALQKVSINPKIAASIAQNPKVLYSQAASYIAKPQQTAENLEPLRQAMIKRDLAYSLNT